MTSRNNRPWIKRCSLLLLMAVHCFSDQALANDPRGNAHFKDIVTRIFRSRGLGDPTPQDLRDVHDINSKAKGGGGLKTDPSTIADSADQVADRRAANGGVRGHADKRGRRFARFAKRGLAALGPIGIAVGVADVAQAKTTIEALEKGAGMVPVIGTPIQIYFGMKELTDDMVSDMNAELEKMSDLSHHPQWSCANRGDENSGIRGRGHGTMVTHVASMIANQAAEGAFEPATTSTGGGMITPYDVDMEAVEKCFASLLDLIYIECVRYLNDQPHTPAKFQSSVFGGLKSDPPSPAATARLTRFKNTFRECLENTKRYKQPIPNPNQPVAAGGSEPSSDELLLASELEKITGGDLSLAEILLGETLDDLLGPAKREEASADARTGDDSADAATVSGSEQKLSGDSFFRDEREGDVSESFVAGLPESYALWVLGY